MEIVICAYEDWMKPQVATLFSANYNVSIDGFSTMMDNFYDHPFQKEKCIRIVALDGKSVVGFQSFFYWPYSFNEKTFRSFQSGNSLVHPDYRSQGIFRRLLEYIDQHRESMGIDLLIGFPIDVSKNSLIRNGWKNILYLDWHVRFLNVFAFAGKNENEKLKVLFKQESIFLTPTALQNKIQLSNKREFWIWRKNYSLKENYFYHAYSENGKTVEFALKTSRRKKVIRELTIGNIVTESHDISFIERGLTEVIQKVRASHCITILSLAQNSNSGFIPLQTLQRVGLKKINKHIYFCVKSFVGEEPVEEKSNWLLFRSDIDTW